MTDLPVARGGVVLTAASRRLRRDLRPLEWVTLEEVALDAVADNGWLVTHTSARRVAQQLGIDPGTAAGALRVLRKRGLLVLEREKGAAGRFGLSVYALAPIDGLTVVSPPDHVPHVVFPWEDQGDAAEPETAPPCVDELRTAGAANTDRPNMNRPHIPATPHARLGSGFATHG